MTSEPVARHSRNITIFILILFFYLACSYSSVYKNYLSITVNSWEIAVCYWLVIGLWLRKWRFLATQLFALIAFAAILTVLQRVTFPITYEMMRETVSASSLPVFIVLFVVGPAIFFSFNFDPYGLIKELPRIVNASWTAHLLLMLSAGEMFQARFAEVSENLMVRGVDLKSRFRRVLSIPTFLPPLLMALIQEAAYRQSYVAMLGCPLNRFPVQTTKTRLSLSQQLALTTFAVLLITRVLI